jgi:hypothetical protein
MDVFNTDETGYCRARGAQSERGVSLLTAHV